MTPRRDTQSIAALVTVALAVLASACVSIGDGVSVRGSGILATRDYDLRDFQTIESSHAFDVRVTRGDAFTVAVTADDNLFDDMVVDVRGGTLEPGLRNISTRGSVTLEAIVTMPALTGVEASGASRITFDGFTTGGRFTILASGASRIEGSLEAGTLEADLSGASRVSLTGRADGAILEGSGASHYELTGFAVATASVGLSGASSADVNVGELLDHVDLSGASRLHYLGSPRLGEVDTSGVSTMSGGG